MSDKTGIEWTDATWNPIRGCSRVSEGCRNCYAETIANRFKGQRQPYEGLIAKSGQWNSKIKLVPEKLSDPLRWKRPRMVFVNSMSDLFHENVPESFIWDVFAIMALATYHTFQILTKRPERMLEFMNHLDNSPDYLGDVAAKYVDYEKIPEHEAWPPQNIWLGVSVEDQKTADERLPFLHQTPAAVRWVSAEPLLGPIYFDLYRGHTDWVVVGGESGANARPMDVLWVDDIRNQCVACDVPFFFKQWGEWAPRWPYDSDQMESDEIAGKWDGRNYRYGKKKTGSLLGGKEHKQWPAVASLPPQR